MDVLSYQLVIKSPLRRELVYDADGVEVLCKQFTSMKDTYKNKQELEFELK